MMKLRYIRGDDMERFWSKVQCEPNTGCWLWEGFVCKDGYPRIHIDGKTTQTTRFIFEKTRGKVPDGLELDHLCRVRSCVNPDHLEAVTHQENMARSDAGKYNRIKTHCPQGHPYSGYNIIRRKGNKRRCRKCSLEQTEAYRLRRKALSSPTEPVQSDQEKNR